MSESKAILQRYAEGERDFRGLELEVSGQVLDFRDVRLREADFSGCFIVADFTNADLSRAKFRGANVKTCSFDGANLSDTDFSEAAIDAATFEGATLLTANFEGASSSGRIYRSGETPA